MVCLTFLYFYYFALMTLAGYHSLIPNWDYLNLLIYFQHLIADTSCSTKIWTILSELLAILQQSILKDRYSWFSFGGLNLELWYKHMHCLWCLRNSYQHRSNCIRTKYLNPFPKILLITSQILKSNKPQNIYWKIC